MPLDLPPSQVIEKPAAEIRYLADNSTKSTADSGFAINSQADLDNILRQLKAKETRIKALAILIDFASSELYRTSSNTPFYADEKTRKLKETAAFEVNKFAKPEMIAEALQSSDARLYPWILYAVTDKDVQLVPILELAVQRKNFDWSDIALEKLMLFPDARQFVKDYVATTRNAWVLIKRVPDESEFNKRIVALLNDPEDEVRTKTLIIIATNKGSAEMFHRPFDRAILDQAIIRAGCTSNSEREAAVGAVWALRKYNLPAATKTILSLASDPVEGIRWRVASSLEDIKLEAPSPELDKATAILLKDPAELVRCFAIISDGAEKHQGELKALSKSKDKQVSDMAKSYLDEEN